jgi:uncharacterized membrane protein
MPDHWFTRKGVQIMAKKTDHVIIAYFAGKDQAATAADEIQEWDKADDAVKLGGIGILTSKNGKIKTHKLVRARSGRAAKWGLALGATAGILSGGVTLVGGAVAGAAVGAVGAKLFHQSLGLSDEDNARLEQRLADGKAAVVVMAAADEAGATKAELATLGGEVEDYKIPEATLAEVEKASEVQPMEGEAGEPEAVAEVTAPEPAAEAEEGAEAAEPVGGAPVGEAAVAAAPVVVRMTGTLESVEGIGPGYVATLKGIGITTKRRLLLAGGTPEGRAHIAKQTKISEKLIMRWVSAVDLSRVTGVKAQNSELLVAGDVMTVDVLAEQEAGELHDRLAKLNAEKKLVRLVPGSAQLGKWIVESKGLPQMVTL